MVNLEMKQCDEKKQEFILNIIPALMIFLPSFPWYLIFVGGAECPDLCLSNLPLPSEVSNIHTYSENRPLAGYVFR